MSGHLPPIYFYIPQDDLSAELPTTADHYWVGFRQGIYCWTLQTYLRLKSINFPCKLVESIPNEGIVLAHWDSLPQNLQPSSKLLIVCFQADRARHPYAQVHVVQNPQVLLKQPRLLGDRYLLPGDIHYMPHWPQPGLIPRILTRGEQFENIVFFGLENNLLPELQDSSWQEQVNALGLRWRIESSFEHWNDYSEVDAVLAVRSFQHLDYIWKPATKLFNAWHAGVPAILGCESAYQAERKSTLDYWEVSSLTDIIFALKRLRDNFILRQEMVENGLIRAQETQPEILTERWKQLITKELIPIYERWCASSWYRQAYLRRHQLALLTRIQRKALQNTRNFIAIRTRMRSLFRKQ